MRVAIRTDDRVGIMNEIIQGIQVIKMYAWERPFQKVVSEARRLEVQQIRYASYLRGVYVSTAVFIERSTLFIAIAACIMMGHSITADIVYSMAQYFNVLQLNAAILYPLALSLGAEALVSIRRIEEFLLKDEKNESELGIERRGSDVLMDKKRMFNCSAMSTSKKKARQKKSTSIGTFFSLFSFFFLSIFLRHRKCN